jgi:NAD(P)-dependent dehydrogenase (short-subunit alcohol dehydrogenase family)
MPIGKFVEETDATADRMIDINLRGLIYGSKLALERFLPRHHGHLVEIASVAGKAGFPGGATYCATKHAVVGLSETLRAELRGSGIGVSVVMPVVVNTELGSGLPKTPGFNVAEPEDVANAIVEALQFSRFEVYVPKRMATTFRFNALLPRRAVEAMGRRFKSDEVLMRPDHAARAAYEKRMADTVAAGDSRSTPPGPADDSGAARGRSAPKRPTTKRGAKAVKADQETTTSEREPETV